MISNNQSSNHQSRDNQSWLEQRVLAIIETLVQEINPRRTVRAELNSSLQRDLGFDSLGLTELILRIEKAFDVHLPDDLLGRLETPLDLINQIARSGGARVSPSSRKSRQLPEAVVERLPDKESTLIGVLEWHVRHSPDRPHILLSDGYYENETISYGDLAKSAGSMAQGMRNWGLEPGEFVGIMLPTGREFFDAFFGALLAGAVPVPMYPPVRLSQLEEHLRRQAGILRNCQAALMIIPAQGKSLSGLLGAQIETLRGVSTVEELRSNDDAALPLPRQPDDLAMLQYTSGSTGDPKGVMLTHANLLSNIRAMGKAIDASSNDVFVSWLPLYHDLGLIGAWFGSLYYAIPVVIMSPIRFIMRPESWLWAIHRNSATLTAAPNFAFELCANKIQETAIEGLDLSSLRMIANGAEPVSAETIRKFTDRFAPYGLRPEAMTPVYGLAENSVGLAFSAIGEKPIIDRVSRQSLQDNEIAMPATADEQHPLSFVSSGVPLPGNEIRIVDSLGREVPERQQGRLEFRGPCATRGYYRQPKKSRALLRDGWLDSSDLAYAADRNIFITGRIKDMIIKGGHNIYPQEIEEAVGELTDIRKGCVAAFASFDEKSGTERLIVVAETRSTDIKTRRELQQTVAQEVSDILGAPADDIIIAAPHTVPKTSSGKIRRSMMRELYETEKLEQPARALWLQVFRLGLMSGVPRLRRILKTLANLAYAGWWWSVLVLLATVNWIAVLSLPKLRWRWSISRFMSCTALRLMRIPFTVSGKEHLNAGAGVFAINHSSYFDVVVLVALLPGEPVFIAKQELSNQRIAGPFLRKLGARFADRAIAQAGVKEVEASKELVRMGKKLVVFPEGTIFRAPGLLPFKMGAFSIACEAGTSVLPIAIRGTRSILRADQWFPRRGIVEVDVLKPVTPDGSGFSSAIQLRDRVRAQILTHCGEPDLAEAEVFIANIDDR